MIHSPGDGRTEQRQGGEPNKGAYGLGVHFPPVRWMEEWRIIADRIRKPGQRQPWGRCNSKVPRP